MIVRMLIYQNARAHHTLSVCTEPNIGLLDAEAWSSVPVVHRLVGFSRPSSSVVRLVGWLD